MLGAVYVASSYEVVDKGRLFDYTTGTIYKIQLVDGVNVYAEKEIDPSLDIFNSLLLFFVASVSAFAALLLRRLGSAIRLQVFFGLAALGAGYLGADELFAIHESIGHNLRFLADLPGVRQPDGPVQAFYAIPALIFLYVFRDLLLASGPARRAFVLGTVLLVVAYMGDGRDFLSSRAEDTLELLASMSYVAAFLLLALHHVAPDAGRAAVLQRTTPKSAV